MMAGVYLCASALHYYSSWHMRPQSPQPSSSSPSS
jgi:hypothetical protein